MEKTILQSIVNKYNLDGLIENAKWEINEDVVNIKGISPNKNLVCDITAPFPYKDLEFVVYGTSRLLKLINVVDKEVDIKFESENHITTKMRITDSSYELEYILADLMLAPAIPSVTEPNYEIKFDLDSDLANKFIKAKKSLDTGVVSITPTQNQTLKFVIGETNNYSDKISFEHPATYDTLAIKSLFFNVDELKSIFQDNRCNGQGFINMEGIIKLQFDDNNIMSEYIIIAE